MLHSIFMALSGHTGDVIVECVGDDRGYRLGPNIELSYADAAMVNSIVKIGYNYAKLRDFCSKVRKNRRIIHLNALALEPYKDVENERYNYYVSAVTNCIEKYLDEYIENLVFIELAINNDPTLSLSKLHILLQEQSDIINYITKIVNEYENSDSTSILNVISSISCGSDATSRIRVELNRVFMDVFRTHLYLWLCHGQLVDGCSEFLILKRPVLPNDNRAKIFSYDSLYTEISSEGYDFEWNYRFYMASEDRHWPFCSDGCRRNILFTGKAVRILIRKYHNEMELEMKAQEFIFNDWNSIFKSQDTFTNAIDNYRNYVSHLLWEYMNESYKFNEQLKLFKDVYLLNNDSIHTKLLVFTWDKLLQNTHKNYREPNINKFKVRYSKHKSSLRSNELVSYGCLSSEGGVWHEGMLNAKNGFEIDISALADFNDFLIVSVILQSKVDPKLLSDNFELLKFVPKIEDYLSIDFRLSHSGGMIRVESFVRTGPKGTQNTWGYYKPSGSCINKGSKHLKFSRKFDISIKFTRDMLMAKIENGTDSHTLITHALDTTKMLTLDHGDCYVGLETTFGGDYVASCREQLPSLPLEVTYTNKPVKSEGMRMSPTTITSPISGSTDLEGSKGAGNSQRVISPHAHSHHTKVPGDQPRGDGVTEQDMSVVCDRAFSLTKWDFNSPESSLLSSSFDYLLNVRLLCRYTWPLTIMISPDEYNEIFQQLFLIRLCLYGLEHYCRSTKDARMDNEDKNIRRLHLFKAKLYSIIKKFYLEYQRDVVSKSHTKLESILNNTNGFQKVKHLHDQHLNYISRNMKNEYSNKLLHFSKICLEFIIKYNLILKDLTNAEPDAAVHLINSTHERLETLIF